MGTPVVADTFKESHNSYAARLSPLNPAPERDGPLIGVGWQLKTIGPPLVKEHLMSLWDRTKEIKDGFGILCWYL